MLLNTSFALLILTTRHIKHRKLNKRVLHVNKQLKSAKWSYKNTPQIQNKWNVIFMNCYIVHFRPIFMTNKMHKPKQLGSLKTSLYFKAIRVSKNHTDVAHYNQWRRDGVCRPGQSLANVCAAAPANQIRSAIRIFFQDFGHRGVNQLLGVPSSSPFLSFPALRFSLLLPPYHSPHLPLSSLRSRPLKSS